MKDLIDRQAAIEALEKVAELFPWRVPGNRDSYDRYNEAWNDAIGRAEIEIEELPSAQPERVWHPVEKPPAHHKDVIVRGVEAIGNVTVHKVMQWDVDTWRPTDYAPSVMWKEWSEI